MGAIWVRFGVLFFLFCLIWKGVLLVFMSSRVASLFLVLTSVVMHGFFVSFVAVFCFACRLSSGGARPSCVLLYSSCLRLGVFVFPSLVTLLSFS